MNIDKTQHGFFYSLLGGMTIAFLVLLAGFFQPIFWAAIIGIVFLPLQNRLEVALGGRHSLAAVITLFVIMITVLVPTFLIAGAVADQGLQLYQRLESGSVTPGGALSWIEARLPDSAVSLLEQLGISPTSFQDRVTTAAVDASGFIAGMAVNIGQNVSRFAVMFFLMLYLLYFALRDGEEMLEKLVWALPLGDEREASLLAKIAEVGRATIKGTLVVGAVQGTLGGLMFWILGIQGWVFWGVVMIFLSILPAVGAAIVWLPASVILMVGGSFVRGMILLLFGALVISLVDNILRPLLVGRDTKMPDWLILLSTLGGLATFGISGFVIGPIIAALFLSVWTMFGEEQEEVERAEQERAGTDGDEASGIVAKAPALADVPGDARRDGGGDAHGGAGSGSPAPAPAS